ncbi:MAG: SNF7 family protein [Candidatus Lokiarchaeota archaeon]|nr:SNF7 family protein [Candidatus Harpocratesius repetitus]
MVFRKLFPSKKTQSEKLTTEARLKNLTHNLDMKIKDYENKAQLCRSKAKNFLKSGNQKAAKTMLIRYKQFQNKILQYNAMIMRAERQLDALEQANVISDVAGTMESAAVELKTAATTVNAERALEITEEAEESIEQINEAGELFAGDPEVDMGIDIDEDLSQLETELMLEDAGQLPETPEEKMESISLYSSESEPEKETKDSDALKKEIEKLKKELDM